MADTWDKIIPIITARLDGNGGKPFIAGTDRPTIADFKTFQILIGVHDSNPASIMPASVKAKFNAKVQASPAFSRWIDTMVAELSSYLAQRPPRPL